MDASAKANFSQTLATDFKPTWTLSLLWYHQPWHDDYTGSVNFRLSANMSYTSLMHTLSASFGSHITCQPEGPGDKRVKIKTIRATVAF